jgi:lipopolysaccharide cholinephosphotransferase
MKTKLFYYSRYFAGMIFSIFSHKYLVDKFDKFVSNMKDNKYCTIPTGRKHYYGETLPQRVFFPVSKAMFEGVEINIPNDVHAYLKNLYGDNYMHLPPEEKRERHFYVEFSLDTTK